jgi:hypothetical protein
VVTTSVFFGFVNLACADVTVNCFFPVLFAEECHINGDTPAVPPDMGLGGTASLPVSFPAFDPRLGQLQQVGVILSAEGTGTATLTFAHDPFDHVFVWGGIPFVAASNPKLFGFFLNGKYFPPTVSGNDLQGFSFRRAGASMGANLRSRTYGPILARGTCPLM